MALEPTEVDTARLDELARIEQEQAGLRELTDKAKAFRDRAVEVCERVVRDYQERISALERQAQDLREKARQDLATLVARHVEAGHAVEQARFEQQEIDFRHEIGELSRAEYPERRKAIDEQLARAEAAFDDVDALRGRFTEALKDAVPPQRVAATRLATPAIEVPTPPPVDGAPPRAEAVPPPLPAPAPSTMSDGDVFGSAPNTVPAAPPHATDRLTPGGTIAMAPAVLREEVAAGDAGQVHQLSFLTTIGRTPDNHIAVAEPEVSRHHARIMLRDSGFVLEDLRSGNGTYLNGVRISGEQPLKHQDRVQVGSRTFIFSAQ